MRLIPKPHEPAQNNIVHSEIFERVLFCKTLKIKPLQNNDLTLHFIDVIKQGPVINN